jgi:hypothetical protein
LLPQHRADLVRSGLGEETVERCGFYSEKDPARVYSLLNWDGRYEGSLGACLVIPYFDAGGADTGYVRLKPDGPRLAGADRKPVKYEAPKGECPRAYFPPGGATAQALGDREEAVIVTEGEKKAAKADEEGFACIGISGVWSWCKKGRQLLDDLAALAWEGRRVYAVFDSDAAENENVRLAARELAAALGARGAVVKVVFLPAAPDGGKVGLDDYLVAGGADALRDLLARPQAEAVAAAAAAPPLPAELPWPDPLAPEAFHGLAGAIVRAIEPATEADPAAILLQTLVGFGSQVGRTAYCEVESDRHHANEFVVLVGKSSKARKGTSWGRVHGFLQSADPDWAGSRVQTGLSSGEGLVWAVRDPITKREKSGGEKGRPVHYKEVEADPGVSDKRLLVLEPEFANVLKQTERQGNTLSALIRQSFDSGSLGTLVKNSPARATGAHISMVGHITRDETNRYLTATEQANGFANRYLWVCARRSKLLPDGGKVDPGVMARLQGKLKDALAFARKQGLLCRDAEAGGIWRGVYGDLSAERPGLTGCILGRAEAHVLRLSLLYALLDKSAQVRAPHLMAALAVWDYCEASARYVFGDGLGDPVADELLRLLRGSPAGLTRTEIRDFFGRNQSADRLGRALALLVESRLARCERQQQTGGRPAERWLAARK